jgi:hypothetical protein
MRFIFSLVLLLLIIILIGVIAVAVLLAVALGLGWIMTLFLPFSWFETTLLALLATTVVSYVASRILLSNVSQPEVSMPDNDLAGVDSVIPESRFYTNESDKTNEAWFRYEIANHIYDELSEIDLDTVLGKPQQKELAIRLTDIFVILLKERPQRKRSRQVTLTVAQVKTQMAKMGQQPYDDDILETAVGVLNLRLSYDEDLLDIVLDKSWTVIDPDW